ncbi:hypothetical protein [Vibrio algarum]|uniref:DUF3718 domain-containing protein n=1 Tax=Vibrio algarum TaxID=3020714 RepID=A0ABT4YT07_9VIBR|nr:hypothetical protein [Vibrio sp. KJ40-1]MDB1124684.1 hypothetical protein [Vibrio sp. KJ40-1]
MLSPKSFLVVFTLCLLPSLSSAKSLSLSVSCGELMDIYSSKNEKKLLAAQTTSLSESLRAGYCLGVIEQYAKSEYGCRSDWYKRAEFIASYASDNNPPSEKKLLRLSCGI